MNNASNFCLANFLDKFVFVIGGCTNKPIKIVSRYDIASNKWETIAELNQARYCAGACSLGGNIYVIAGRNS